MRIYCSGTAIIEKEFSQERFKIESDELIWDADAGTDRGMGPETIYTAAIEHPELGQLEWTISEYPFGVENFKETKVGKNRIIKDFEFGLEAVVEHESEFDIDGGNNYVSHHFETEVEEIVEWFRTFYEDPQIELPYDKEDGEYKFVYGGPYDAEEEIFREFSNRFGPDVIDAAIKRVLEDGIYEWAPSPKHPDQILVENEHANRMREESAKGNRLYFRRDAKKTSLNGIQLSKIISQLFRSADGEFSFALLGRWGSGKTNLSNLITLELTDPSDQKSSLGEKTYEAINFNAWKYKERPGIWVYLHESFVQSYLNQGLICSTIRIIRFNILRIGILQTLVALLVTALLAAPLMWAFSLLPLATSLFGASLFVSLILLIRSWTASVKKIYDQYGLISTHRSHLGMQAVIGDDLKLLVRSWIKPAQPQGSYIWAFHIGLAIITVAWIYAAVNLPSATAILTEYFGINSGLAGNKYQPLYLASLFVWVVVSGVFSYSILYNRDRVDRLLLVIDDLDRCHAEEIVDIIDGVKMILDDGVLGNSIQALILADKDVLKLSIEKRMRNIFTNKEVALAAVEEHIEKVFLCHLEVPKLDYNDARQLVNEYADEFGVQDQDQDENYLDRKTPQKEFILTSEHPSHHQPSPPEINFVLSRGERASIQRALSFVSNAGGKSLTPRLIRSFMFKYQICRVLLQMQRLDFDHGEITDILAKNISGEFDGSVSLQDDRILNTIKMVL